MNPSNQAPQAAVPTGGPNANPLDLFPQVGDFFNGMVISGYGIIATHYNKELKK